MLDIVETPDGFNVVDKETGEVKNKKPFSSREEAVAFMDSLGSAQQLTNAGAKPVAKPKMGAPGVPSGEELAAVLGGLGGAKASAPPLPGMMGGRGM